VDVELDPYIGTWTYPWAFADRGHRRAAADLRSTGFASVSERVVAGVPILAPDVASREQLADMLEAVRTAGVTLVAAQAPPIHR
jgi:hypothetical protein